LRIFAFLAFAVTLQGCVTAAVCTQEGAFDTGRQQALAGKPADLNQGSACGGDSYEIFRSSYEKGYEAGRQLLCSVQNASDDGRDAGLQGQNATGLPLRYQICQGDKASLEKAFMSAYKRGLDEHCALDSAKNRGDQAGRSNQTIVDMEAVFLACPQAQRSKLKQSYQTAYLSGLRAYCQPQQHLDSIRKQAEQNSRPSYDPATYGNCAQRFPELLEAYNALFYRERNGVVQKLCTFESGLDQGKADAARSNQRMRGAPEFCDEATQHAYLRGYDRGWADQKREICLMEDFNERGYHDATQGLPANPHFPDLCPSDFYSDMRDRYHAGYERGRRHGSHRPHPGGRPDARDDLVTACGRVFNFDSEKLQCIKESQQIRFGAADVVKACGEAFSFHSDRMKCITSAAGRNYNPTTVIRTCKSSSTFHSDVESCITTVKNTRYEPSKAIQACHESFNMSSDRKACLDFIAKEQRDPSARIRSCKKSFNFASDALKCLGT
jgi:hypothetical protein